MTTLLYGGIPVRIDRPVGFVQRGVGPGGVPWERTYKVPYGEIDGTEGGDGDKLDVFCGPNPDAPQAFWAEQRKRDGSFDEFKLGLGFTTRATFIACYCAHIPTELLGRVWSQPVSQVRALLGLDPQALMRAAQVRCDLGVGDVHVPSARWRPSVVSNRPSKDPMATKTTTVAAISPAKRKSLPEDKFALPAKRAYPIDTAARVRNAAARLEQNKSGLSPAEYAEAKRNIAAAAKRFGIESEYNKPGSKKTAAAPAAPTRPRRPGIHVRYQSPGGHHLEIRHSGQEGGAVTMSDRPVFGDKPVDIDRAPLDEVATQLADVERRLAALPEGEERAALTAEAVKLADDLVAPRWNQVAKVGTFLGHPAGPFELTPAVFDQILANYRDVDKGQVPIDFEHASEADETSGSIPSDGAPAQGWILDLQNRGEAGLWGLCRFLEPALGYVRAGKYRFFSPAIRFGAKHPETGKPIGARLTSVGLVNRPFLRGLQPLAARDPSAPGATVTMSIQNPHEMMKSMKACMGLHPLATFDKMKACVADMRDAAKPILEKDRTHATGFMAGGANMGDYIHPLADLMGSPANTTVAEILDAVEEMIDSAMAAHEAIYHADDDLDAAMRDGDATKLAAKLGEATEKLRTMAGEKATLVRDKATLAGEKASLSLALKDEQAKVATLTADLATANGTIVTLRDAEVQRGVREITETVEEAFTTYQDVRKLTADDKADMLILAKADLARFKLRYPRMVGKEHLMRDLTTGRQPNGGTAPHLMGGAGAGGSVQPITAPGPQAPQPGAPVMNHLEMIALSDRLKRERGMSNEDATSASFAIAMGARPNPFTAATAAH